MEVREKEAFLSYITGIVEIIDLGFLLKVQKLIFTLPNHSNSLLLKVSIVYIV